MGQFIMDRIPDSMEIMGVICSFAIPYIVYKVNQKLHKSGDPPWKKKTN